MTHIHVSMRHGDLPQDIEDFVGQKIQRMDKYLKDSSRVEVILDQEKEQHKCEVILHSARRTGQIVVKDSGEDLKACIDTTLEKLQRQVTKDKERRKDHHRGSRSPEAPPASEEAPEEPSYEDIVNREIKGR